jgi:hypothetical protein
MLILDTGGSLRRNLYVGLLLTRGRAGQEGFSLSEDMHLLRLGYRGTDVGQIVFQILIFSLSNSTVCPCRAVLPPELVEIDFMRYWRMGVASSPRGS